MFQILAGSLRSPGAAKGGAVNNTIAAFLVARGASSVLELPVLGVYDEESKYYKYSVWISIATRILFIPIGTEK